MKNARPRYEQGRASVTRGATLVRLAAPQQTKKTAGDGGFAGGASLTPCARLTAANPARHFLRATPRPIPPRR